MYRQDANECKSLFRHFGSWLPAALIINGLDSIEYQIMPNQPEKLLVMRLDLGGKQGSQKFWKDS